MVLVGPLGIWIQGKESNKFNFKNTKRSIYKPGVFLNIERKESGPEIARKIYVYVCKIQEYF